MYIKNTLNYITTTESGHIILNQTKPQNIYYIHMIPLYPYYKWCLLKQPPGIQALARRLILQQSFDAFVVAEAHGVAGKETHTLKPRQLSIAQRSGSSMVI